MTANPYGYCPMCGAPGRERERRPNGFDVCTNKHVYLSAKAVEKAPQRVTGTPADFLEHAFHLNTCSLDPHNDKCNCGLEKAKSDLRQWMSATVKPENFTFGDVIFEYLWNTEKTREVHRGALFNDDWQWPSKRQGDKVILWIKSPDLPAQ